MRRNPFGWGMLTGTLLMVPAWLLEHAALERTRASLIQAQSQMERAWEMAPSMGVSLWFNHDGSVSMTKSPPPQIGMDDSTVVIFEAMR